MLIAGAEVAGRAPLDVRLAGGRIDRIAPALARRPGEPVLEAAGGALLPGLHDHHLHLFALAATARSPRCGPPEVRDARALARALRAAPGGGWVRGVGYHESVAGELDRERLDALGPERPVRVQHRSGALWILNSRAVAALGLDAGADAPGIERDARGRATGRVYDADRWLRERLPTEPAPPLAEVGRRLASYGVTGVTDATPGNGPAELSALEAAVETGALRQRLLVMGGPELPEPRHPYVARGALKLYLAERALPDFDGVRDAIAAAHARGRGVALHCVTRAELVFGLTALAEAGARPGDRIEHASVAPPDVIARLRALPATVVFQPGFLRERGDAYRAEVPADERPWLHRGRGFLAAGIALGAGTDAPFGDPDPWRALRAAVERRSESGAVLGEEERLDPERALALFTSPPESPGGAPRPLSEGAPADLCLLARPWRRARERLDSADVVATWRSGELVWQRDAEPPARAHAAPAP